MKKFLSSQFLLENAYAMVNPIDSDPGLEPTAVRVVATTVQEPEPEEEECDLHAEQEEDDLSISNARSVCCDAGKIVCFLEQGGHLSPWQQQKLAIVMDNLSEIAKRLPA